MPRAPISFCLLLFSVASVASTRGASAQEAGLAFLRVGANASAIGQGDAYVAQSRDAFSTFWNPAGLAWATKNSVSLSHHIWVADVRTYGVAGRFKAGRKGGIGLFAVANDSGELERRDVPGPPEGTFVAQFFTVGAGYARSFGPVSAGFAVKYLSEKIFTERATGYAVDLGLQAAILSNSVRLGAAAQNFGSMTELDAKPTDLPETLRGGATVVPFKVSSSDGTDVFSIAASGEVSYIIPNEETRFHLGLAGLLFEIVEIRAGYLTNDALRGVTGGVGINYASFVFDYAIVPFESGFGGPGHVLTVNYVW